MTLVELIDAARRKQGTLGHVAEQLGIAQSRISEWKIGKFKPSATSIAQLAEMAQLPVLETVADVEAQLHPEAGDIWQRALGKLRAAGVAATVSATVGTVALMGAPTDASASPAAKTPDRLIVMSTH